MRLVVPIIALLISALSASLDLFPPALASPLCVNGLCRSDQILTAVNAAGATPEAVSVLVYVDPANPLVWCTYAEILSVRGETQKAEYALDRAVALGPSMPPVLMRVANYDFTHGRQEQGFLLSARILSQTNSFDEIVFSYLLAANVPARTLLGTAVPATSRPAQAWLSWLRTHGSDQDVGETWAWMKGNRLVDEKSAGEVAWALWNRASYGMAYALWSDWLGAAQLLANTNFGAAPRATPFDWAFSSGPAAAIVRTNGLEVRFAGTENVAFSQVRQFTVAAPGRYRFTAEVGSENLTTDQRPFFRIFDPADQGRLSVETGAVEETVAKTRIAVDFTVTSKAEPLAVELDRRPSERFDNRISGTLHVYQVSLVPIPTATK